MDPKELESYRKTARREGLRLSEWVRLRLRQAQRDAPVRKAEKKLRAIAVATSYSFPTADIDQLLDEIDAGRNAGNARNEMRGECGNAGNAE